MGNICVRNHRILLFVSAIVLFFILLLMFTTHAFAAATYTIKDDATGGDCVSIGEWNPATKTCRVTGDVSVQDYSGLVITGNGITLDGNGHTLINSFQGTECALCAFQVQDVTIKNFRILNSVGDAISVYNARGIRLSGCEISGTTENAFMITDVVNSQISGNLINNAHIGFLAQIGNGNQIVNNHISGTLAGIIWYQEMMNNLIYNNNFSNNTYGLYLMNMGESIDNYAFWNNFCNSPPRIDMGNFCNLARPDGGNYWDTWNTPDADNDGFVDTPYVFTNNVDSLPLSHPVNLSGRPDLALVNDGANWASYADYIARSLTVSYSIRNNGSSGAYAVSVNAATSTGGVSLTTALPVYFGSIGPLDTNSRLLTYTVPAGVVSFRAELDAIALDLTGISYTYP